MSRPFNYLGEAIGTSIRVVKSETTMKLKSREIPKESREQGPVESRTQNNVVTAVRGSEYDFIQERRKARVDSLWESQPQLNQRNGDETLRGQISYKGIRSGKNACQRRSQEQFF
ncbi:hypothetical protein HHI36_019792 [Cryptolaemus montrouzieri]|uniref:Uncharacterized protein n=1 Tax=Cryptolaemus montrouzieri TaxID=559131 RepID=A0ABD2N961_9CUCU